jgi:Fur family zinc uptake transcriptional regulator
MTFVASSINILRKADAKLTGPRRAVLAVLEKVKTPLSAYDIEEQIPENIPISVVTIYRILDLFEKLGIVHRIHTKEGYVRCDYEKERGCHYFAVCKSCGKSFEFLEPACRIEKIIPKNLPFKNVEHISEIAGICDHCFNTNK